MLSNHDQNRIGSIAEGNLEKLKMAANLLLTLPGNPYLYYGEELGMKGTKPDENIREAFQWDKRQADKDRPNWRKPRFNSDSKTTPLRQQIEDENSIYKHYKKLIALRKSIPALVQVSPPNLQKSEISNKKIVSFIRPHSQGDVLVIQNITNENAEILVKEQGNLLLFASGGSSVSQQKAIIGPYGMVVLAC
jgi:glycosidase